MKLTVKDINGKDQGELTVQFPLVEGGKGTQAVHDTVVAYLANQRMGTACTKTMGEVTGTGKKPWRQKGTGRARAGSFQSPLWVGGGVVFGPKPHDFGRKVTKKTKQLALRKALTERLNAGDVLVVDNLTFDEPKTKKFLAVMKSMGLAGSTLVVTEKAEKNLTLAARNVAKVEVATSAEVNTYQVLRPKNLLFTRGAFEKLEARLKD